MELLEHLGRNIVRVREERGMEQRDLALLLGRSPSTLCSLEKGRTYPHMSMVEQLQEIFQVDALELFGSEEEVEIWKKVQFIKRLFLHENHLRRFSEKGKGKQKEEAASLLYSLIVLREVWNGTLEERFYKFFELKK